MKKSKLVQLLKSLSKQEFAELEHFVKCPSHNKDKDAIKMYEQLKRAYPEFDNYRVKKERMAKMIYGADNLKNINRLKYPMSALSKCIEELITWKTLEKSKNDYDFVTLRGFQERGLDKIFLKKTEDIQKRLDTHTKIEPSLYYHQFQLQSILYRHPNTHKLTTKLESILVQKNYNLDLFYFSSKLTEYLILLNRTTLVDDNRKLSLIEEVIEEIEKNPVFRQHPLLSIYIFFIKYLPSNSTFNPSDYYATKEIIFKNISSFGDLEKRNIFILLHQYVNSFQDRNVSENHIQEEFDAILFGIEHKILYQSGYIMPFAFFNTTQLACELDKHEWVENFIERKGIHLPENHKENILLVCKANLYNSINKHEEALVLLRDVVYKKHYYYDIIVKTISIKCFYQMQEHELLENYLVAFNAFIKRHKEMSPTLKGRYLGFAKVITLLEKHRVFDEKPLEEIVDTVKKNNAISFKSWLLKQILLLQ